MRFVMGFSCSHDSFYCHAKTVKLAVKYDLMLFTTSHLFFFFFAFFLLSRKFCNMSWQNLKLPKGKNKENNMRI